MAGPSRRGRGAAAPPQPYATLIGLLMLWCSIVNTAGAISFDLNHGQKQCFTEKISSDTRVYGEYLVRSGKDSMPITLSVHDSGGHPLVEKESIDHGRFTFTTAQHDDYAYEYDDYAQHLGQSHYHICFEHKLEAQVGHANADINRRITFKLRTGSAAKDYEKLANDEHMSELEILLEEMNDELHDLNAEIVDARHREDNLRKINENVNKRVIGFSVASILVMIAVGGYQTYYMRTFFKKKKLI